MGQWLNHAEDNQGCFLAAWLAENTARRQQNGKGSEREGSRGVGFGIALPLTSSVTLGKRCRALEPWPLNLQSPSEGLAQGRCPEGVGHRSYCYQWILLTDVCTIMARWSRIFRTISSG